VFLKRYLGGSIFYSLSTPSHRHQAIRLRNRFLYGGKPPSRYTLFRLGSDRAPAWLREALTNCISCVAPQNPATPPNPTTHPHTPAPSCSAHTQLMPYSTPKTCSPAKVGVQKRVYCTVRVRQDQVAFCVSVKEGEATSKRVIEFIIASSRPDSLW